jgi:hypothetical protein
MKHSGKIEIVDLFSRVIQPINYSSVRLIYAGLIFRKA